MFIRMVEKHYGHLAPNYVADTVRAAFDTMGLVQTDSWQAATHMRLALRSPRVVYTQIFRERRENALAIDKRMHERRSMSYPGWIDLGEGFKPVPCHIKNVSQEDAEITVPPTDTIPDEFYLRFSLTGVTRRRCVVKSRLPGSIRVQFIKQK